MPHNSEQIRSFIAIELPQNVQSGLGQIRSELERAEHPFIKWVNPESIHLTLKFLGNIPFNRVTEIAKAMDEATQGASPFHLEISGLGGFPNLKQPRVIWVGIKGEIDKLLSLQQNIDSALALLGFVREERPFMPHLTLARIKERASPAERKSLGELVMSTSLEISYPFEVMAVSLMRSQLTPEGAVYTCQFAARLKA
ncbi:MAG TPA: RNA 2',3'-cyclic phosphodiesterase [Dehalococcoidia bacterium]|nr:RNA 2',3'-cyclic phosphodiesterase [Dehalococcoidia bacterium]